MSATKQPTGTTTPDRSTELVDRLLKLPEEVRIDLAHLLLDSVRDGFTSLEEAAKKQTDLIRSRIEQLMRGDVELLDADEVVNELERRYGKEPGP